MGNWSTGKQAAIRDVVSRIDNRRAELAAKYPPIERPCGTPGAVYSIIVDGTELTCSVHLPFDIDSAIPESAKDDMKRALHDAVLPIVERFYRDVWEKTLAGKKIDGDSNPLPRRWGLLFTKWIRNRWQNGYTAKVDGNDVYNWYGLPDDHSWSDPDRGDKEGAGYPHW